MTLDATAATTASAPGAPPMDATPTASLPPAVAAPAPALAPPAKLLDAWSQLLLVPTAVSVHVPVVQLTVRALFRLDKGSIVVTSQASGANAPLCVGDKILAWGEFQVVSDTLALRIAELA